MTVYGVDVACVVEVVCDEMLDNIDDVDTEEPSGFTAIFVPPGVLFLICKSG